MVLRHLKKIKHRLLACNDRAHRIRNAFLLKYIDDLKRLLFRKTASFYNQRLKKTIKNFISDYKPSLSN